MTVVLSGRLIFQVLSGYAPSHQQYVNCSMWRLLPPAKTKRFEVVKFR
jgi:hypothetical protein